MKIKIKGKETKKSKTIKSIVKRIVLAVIFICISVCQIAFAGDGDSEAATNVVRFGMAIVSAVPGIKGFFMMTEAFEARSDAQAQGGGGSQGKFAALMAGAVGLLLLCVAINLKGTDLVLGFFHQ